MMKSKAASWIGWFGVAAILVAYLATNFGWLEFKGQMYLWLNLLGSVAIIVETWKKKDYQPLTLNVVWALVALIGVISLF